MCDVTSDEQMARLFEQLKAHYGVLHGLVHSVAFAPAEELKGEFVNTTREGFRIAHDVSVYSLIAVSRAAAPLMTEGRRNCDHDVLRRGEGGAEVQRDGRGEGGAGGNGAVPGERSGAEGIFA